MPCCVKDKFKTGLLSSSEEFKRQVSALLDEFHANGPFASHISCEKAFEIIASIKLQLAQLKEDEATLRRGLAIFKIDLPPSKDIAKVEVVWIRSFHICVVVGLIDLLKVC